MTFDEIDQWLTENEATAILADGLEYALIGFNMDGDHTVAVYDYAAIIMVMLLDGMSRDEAEEYFDYNIERGAAAQGPYRPLFILRPNRDVD
mgnify:CR=1 FL=1